MADLRTGLDVTVSTLPGDAAHDAVDAGNPLKIGGKALTGIPTPVADADRVNAWFDEYGRPVVSDKDNELGLTGGVTGLRDRLVAERYTVLADSLADGINTFWTQTTANGGTITSTVGEGQLKTSTATNGSSQIVSPTVPYYPGQVAWLNSAVRFGDTGTAGNIRRLGMYTVSGTTPQEGFYYELSGTTLNAVVVKGASATATASGSWSRNAVAPFTLDTNYHSFEIRYTANTVWFLIDNVLRHSVSGTSSALTTSLTLPIAATNVKTSGATDITLAIRNIGTGRFGKRDIDVTASDSSVVYNGAIPLIPKFAVIDHATSGNNTVVAAVTSKKIRVHQCFLVAAGAVTVRFESGADGTALTGQMNVTTNSGFTLPFSPMGWFETASNTLLNLELSGAVSCDGVIGYTEV